MFVPRLKVLLQRFRDDSRGSITVETVIALPLLFWAAAASYDFHDIHRYKSAREKATYTVADMISREELSITDNYMDKTLQVFNDMVSDGENNQIRVSVVEYNGSDEIYELKWSETRGSGDLEPLRDEDVRTAHASLPILTDGQQVILVETSSTFKSLFSVGLSVPLEIETRMFTAPRFVPQVTYEAVLGQS
jgi:hypothetical protein